MSKIVLVGAGSVQFGCGTLGDIFQSDTLKSAEIVLHDINDAAVRRVHAVATDFAAAHEIPATVSHSTDLPSALAGADFVIISIEVGDRFALWEQDWRIPQQYGIHQVYGENGGPGGLFHALRIIPPILDICATVMEIAPDATVFNYSNPMSRICTTVHRKFPDLNFVGLCHEIASLERHLAPLLGVDRSQLSYRAAGLNHFSVLLEATVDGRDAYDAVRKKAPAYFANLPGFSEHLAHFRATGEVIETEGFWNRPEMKSSEIRPWSDRWLFREILTHFGFLPITTDSHFGEYITWAHDASDHRGILDFYTYYKNHLGTSEPRINLELKERVVPIMEGILADSGYEEGAVNIPNRGAIRQLPDWITVEVPAHIRATGPDAIAMDMPAGIAALLCNQIGIHDLTAEAVLQGSRDLTIQAVLADPITTKFHGVAEMVDLMIDEQRDWLGYLT